MKKSIKKLFTSGIWIQPIVLLVIIRYLQENNPSSLMKNETWCYAVLVSFLAVLIVWSFSVGQPNPEDAITGKQAALYPNIHKKLLFKNPTGIVFGLDKKTQKYVCKDISDDGHIFLIGGSGSGKSSCHVIPTLLSNPDVSKFAIDIKGELSYKSTRYGSEKVVIFNPLDRSQYGYDPLFLLKENSTQQEILETMKNISFSLIPKPAEIKDPFWKDSARNLLTGLLIYFYKKGYRDFIDLVDQIRNTKFKDTISNAMNEAGTDSAEYSYLNQFDGLPDETLGGIVLEITNHIDIFKDDQDIRYAFKYNPCKISPLMLEEGYSIFLSIKEEKLSEYYDVLQLIINQTLFQLEKRPEDASRIIFVIDELPRVLSEGKIDRLLDAARTLRSRNVTLFLITQTTEALMGAYTENEVSDLIGNCSYVVVLNASTSKTQKSIISWVGKYRAKKTTWNGSGKDRKINVSYEDIDLIEASELRNLEKTSEAILISPYGYCRVKKTPYFSDKHFKSKVDRNIKYNETIKGLGGK